jgi:hypothetical protein
MDNTEMLIYLKMVEVCDLARSHFLFEIVEPQVKRFLNAERLKAEALAPPLTLSYTQYRSLLLERTQNSKLTQDLLNYILKPREEGCPVYLWVAERISEANLLAVNGLAMSNPGWPTLSRSSQPKNVWSCKYLPFRKDPYSIMGGDMS